MIQPALSPPLITIDTNVIVSGGSISLLAPAQIIRAWKAEEIKFALCEAIVSEVEEVLSRPYFAQRVGWTQEKIGRFIKDLKTGSLMVPAKTLVNVCRDPDDNMVLACAWEAQANYIVSGDKDVTEVGTFRGIPILTPTEFVQVMQKAKSQTVMRDEKAA